MSYLNGPRINFWGGGSTNVDTANNADNGIVDLVSASVVSTAPDATLIEQLRQPAQSGGQNYYTEAGWNYYGDHQVLFMSAKVSSSGHPGAVAPGGPLDGAPVYLLGSIDPASGAGPYGGAVMVDLDPTSSQSTQIYVGGFQIGGATPLLKVRCDTRCHSHLLGLRYDRTTTKPPFLTPGSVYANGTFQLGFPKSSIVSYDASIPILKDLIEAPGAIGIVVRFCMFEFMPGKSTDQVQADYRNNYNNPNPSLGRIIGTIGPWLEGEPATCPAGRLLQNQNLGGAQGVAILDAQNNRLSLDLSSALPGQAIRQQSTANTAPIGPNVDYGDLRIGTAAGSLATTPSLPDTYYLYGGIYDVSLDPAAVDTLANNPIVVDSTTGTLKIVEAPIRICSDARNIYIDDAGGKAAIEVVVTQLGGPVRAPVDLALSTGVSGTYPDAQFLNYPTSVTVPAGRDRTTFVVSDNGGAAGFLALNFSADHAGPWFVNFRKYPTFDYHATLAAGPIPWRFVYEECLRYYYVLFPAMSKRIPLNDQATVTAVAGEFLKRLSDAYRPTTLYMPLTRSMPPTKVALLRAYLEQVSAPPAA